MSVKTRKKRNAARVSQRKKRTRRPLRPSGAATASQSDSEASFSPRKLLKSYLDKDWTSLSRTFVALLNHFAKYNRFEIGPKEQVFVDALVENLLYFLTKRDYVIPDAFAEQFIRMQPVLANLVAMSSFDNTDPQVRMLSVTRRDLVKLLTLYSARNTVRIEPKRLFDIDPYYASVWYSAYFFSTESSATEVTCRNMRDHVRAMDPRYVLFGPEAVTPFFRPTYVDIDNQRPVRERINQLVRSACRSVSIRNRPRADRIAIVTQLWMPTTSVYRSIYPFVAALKDDYEMTLVRVGEQLPSETELDDSLFADVREVSLGRGGIAAGEIADNDFQLVYYPDVGMSRETIYLSNLRIAPIQVTGYGHPVSTFGSQIDYFIGGAEGEIAEDAEENYSERLVLLPGLGAYPVWPSYKRRNPPKDTAAVVVNCPWTPMKVNYPLLQALCHVLARSDKKILFRFFPACGLTRLNAFIPFCRDLESVLGAEHVRVVPNCTQEQYMAKMETGDLSLDPYPFGGYNTIVDSLYLGKPIVSRQGTKWYNRAASALLKRTRLDELIATSAEDYSDKILRLIQDDDYRRRISQRIGALDLKGEIFDTRQPAYFKKAIDFLIANHERLQADDDSTPILIR